MDFSLVTLTGEVAHLSSVKSAELPTVAGEIGVFPQHVPLITKLARGLITVTTQEGVEHYTVADGIAEITRDSVTVFAETAETLQAAEEALAKATHQETKDEALKEARMKAVTRVKLRT